MACSVVGATVPKTHCACDSAQARALVPDLLEVALRDEMKQKGIGGPDTAPCAEYCLCEILPAGGSDSSDGYADCLNNENSESIGWCYIDPARGLGNPELVEACVDDPRLLKFSDAEGDLPATGSTTFIACLGVGN